MKDILIHYIDEWEQGRGQTLKTPFSTGTEGKKKKTRAQQTGKTEY